MNTRLIAAAAALTLGLSTIANAQLSETKPSDAKPVEAKSAEARPVDAKPARPATVHAAKYSGGEGSTWKTGKDTHGFSGTYGGCRYTGFAGPHGYRLDKVC